MRIFRTLLLYLRNILLLVAEAAEYFGDRYT